MTTPAGAHSRRAVVAVAAGTTLVVLVLLTAVTGAVLGYRCTVIRTASMTPGLPVGSLVLERPVDAADLHRGDVVTYFSAVVGARVTHRVVSVHQARGRVDVITRGDANPTAERWSVPQGTQVGVAVLHVAAVGGWFDAMSGRWLVLVTVLLVVGVLVAPGRRPRTERSPA